MADCGVKKMNKCYRQSFTSSIMYLPLGQLPTNLFPFIIFTTHKLLTPHKLKNSEHQGIIMICTVRNNSYSNNALNTGGSISGRVISLCVSARGPQNIVKKTQLLLMRIYLCAGTLSLSSPTKKSMSQATWLVHMWRLQNWRFLQDCQSSMMEAAIPNIQRVVSLKIKQKKLTW